MVDGLEATLIFPCCVPEGVAYAGAARERGEKVVAASSLACDATAGRFETWFRLPSVYDGDFVQHLEQAVGKYDIARIYCPVPVAYAALNRLAREGKLSVPLVGEMPDRRHAREHRTLMESAVAAHRLIQAVCEGRSPLGLLEVASVLRQSLGIPGQSDEAKIAAMMAIFADAPSGDVVEIGVLAGRTACVLAMMAQRHATGAVLVVDPWSIVEASQGESTEDVQTVVERWDTTAQFETFIIGLLPVAARGNFNYLAASSREAHRLWRERRVVETSVFGTVRYSDAISVLHVDGNHDFACVSQDCACWLPHMAPQSWLVLDDYVSFHCDGPRRVGDMLLSKHAGAVERSFVCGKALFIKLNGPEAGGRLAAILPNADPM
jgi:hypothetical protein